MDRHRPNIRLDAFLDESTATFYLDTSGEPLFKRGHRVVSVEAPLRENLAAGLLRLAGWTSSDVLLDPMCGSGTIPLEAALMARRIAPGQSRSFAFERLLVHDAKRWGHLREASRLKQLAEVSAAIYASDQDPAAVKIAQRTFQGAGVAVDIRLRQSEVLARRDELDARVAALDVETLARPETWGGFRVVPEVWEFWQHRDDRLHDRFRYRRAGGAWVIERLYP